MRQYFSLFRNNGAVCFAKAERVSSKSSAKSSTKAKRDLSADHQLIARIARAAADLVSCHDLSGAVDHCSFSPDLFAGLDPEDFLGQGFMQRVHIGDRPACLNAFSRALHEKGELVRIELRLRCPDQELGGDFYRWIEMSCEALPQTRSDQQQAGAKILAVSRDISRFKAREEELLAREQALIAKNENRSRYLANMSHELRTPLNAIIGFSEMMSVPAVIAGNEVQMVEYAQIINESGKNLLRSVDDIFDMSKLEDGSYRPEPQNFALAELVAASLDMVQSEAAQRNIRLLVKTIDADLRMSSDWRLCRQLVVDLLAAHIKNCARNGRLCLDVQRCGEHISFAVASLDGEKSAPLHPVRPDLLTLLQGRIVPVADETGSGRVMAELPCCLSGPQEKSAAGDTVVPLREKGASGVRLRKKSA